MACEYIAPAQTVLLNSPVLFNDSIPCMRNRVYHNNGDGTFLLRGMNRRRCCCQIPLTEYQVTFAGNIAIPTGGTVGPIAVALAIGGEIIEASRSIATPAAVDEYSTVVSTRVIKVPWDCCPSVSVEYVSGAVDDPAFVPTPAIQLVSGNLTISPVNE